MPCMNKIRLRYCWGSCCLIYTEMCRIKNGKDSVHQHNKDFRVAVESFSRPYCSLIHWVLRKMLATVVTATKHDWIDTHLIEHTLLLLSVQNQNLQALRKCGCFRKCQQHRQKTSDRLLELHRVSVQFVAFYPSFSFLIRTCFTGMLVRSWFTFQFL